MLAEKPSTFSFLTVRYFLMKSSSSHRFEKNVVHKCIPRIISRVEAQGQNNLKKNLESESTESTALNRISQVLFYIVFPPALWNNNL